MSQPADDPHPTVRRRGRPWSALRPSRRSSSALGGGRLAAAHRRMRVDAGSRHGSSRRRPPPLPPSGRAGTGGSASAPPRRRRNHAAAPPDRALGVADGRLPDGVTVADDTYPAVAEPRPGAAGGALRSVGRGWVPASTVQRQRRLALPRYEEQLLDEAVATYGSRAAAARWVATPATSSHVWGTRWTSRTPTTRPGSRGTAPGTGCARVFRNEPWHYELAARGRRRRVPGPVHRPHLRPEDAAVTVTGHGCRGDPHAVPAGTAWPPCSWSTSRCWSGRCCGSWRSRGSAASGW